GADFDRAGDERKNVVASRHHRKRRDIEIARRRIHRPGRRNAGLRLRRTRSSLESRRHRLSRRISARPPGKSDRVRFLITAGPTREPIDPVRYVSNRSSGKMGYAIAEAALEAGHEVVLISGPVGLNRPRGAAVVPISTSDQMFDAVQEQTRNCDVLVMCAAVADYKPIAVFTKKLKKRDAKLSLELIPTRDILASLPKSRKYFVVGFAAETES